MARGDYQRGILSPCALINKFHFCIFSDVSQTPDSKRKIPSKTVSSQTSPSLNAASNDNLTPESSDKHYWEKEAENKRVDLEESLIENQELYERIASLEEEFELSESLIVEAENLVEVLTDILKEDESNENSTEAEQKTDHKSDEEETTV